MYQTSRQPTHDPVPGHPWLRGATQLRKDSSLREIEARSAAAAAAERKVQRALFRIGCVGR